MNELWHLIQRDISQDLTILRSCLSVERVNNKLFFAWKLVKLGTIGDISLLRSAVCDQVLSRKKVADQVYDFFAQILVAEQVAPSQ